MQYKAEHAVDAGLGGQKMSGNMCMAESRALHAAACAHAAAALGLMRAERWMGVFPRGRTTHQGEQLAWVDDRVALLARNALLRPRTAEQHAVTSLPPAAAHAARAECRLMVCAQGWCERVCGWGGGMVGGEGCAGQSADVASWREEWPTEWRAAVACKQRACWAE